VSPDPDGYYGSKSSGRTSKHRPDASLADESSLALRRADSLKDLAGDRFAAYGESREFYRTRRLPQSTNYDEQAARFWLREVYWVVLVCREYLE